MTPAVLKHYSRRGLKDAAYPCIVEQDGASVEGVLIENLTLFHLNLLDRFEGEEYRRIDVKVSTEFGDMETQTYYWIDDVSRVSSENWNGEWLNDENAVFDWLQTENI